MGLMDRLLGRSTVVPAPLPSMDNYWPYLNFGGNLYPIGGLNQTLPGSKVEEIDGSFSGLVAGAYQANGVVFACMLVRMLLFSEARFQYQRMAKGRPGNLYGDQSLDILEHPWPGGTTGDLLAEILTYADLAGNAYIVRRGSRLAVLRPDHVGIVLDRPSYDIDAIVAGYVYYPGGKFSGEDSVFLQRSEVAHFAPIKDPLARYRGMSPLRPIVREFMADSAATSHKLAFFSNSATPNMVIKLPPLAPDKFQEAVKALREAEPAGRAAYKTLFLESGADISVVGANLRQMDFKQTQGAGETRIAAALGVPPIIVGLSEGLQAATYSNYGQARRRFADGTMHPLWRNIAGSLETIVPAKTGSRLWVDVRDIPFLREDEKDLADVQALQMQSLRTGLDAGWEADAVVDAVMANDLSLLKGKHTGLFSVQLQAPGSTKMPQGEAPGEQPVAGPGGPEKPAINPAAAGNGKAKTPTGGAK